MAHGCAKLLQCLLFVTNCIILVCGIAVFGVGLWALLDGAFMQTLLGSQLYKTSCTILIATGLVVAFISFLGCWGAMKENKFMLLLYFTILFVIFITMLVGGAMGYIFRNKVEQGMKDEMVKTIPKFDNDTAVTTAWNAVQVYFKCCGLRVENDDSYMIWQKKGNIKNGTLVPESCCNFDDPDNFGKCLTDPKNYAYQNDCYVQMRAFLKTHAKILGGVGIGIACFLIVGLILSCCLILNIA